jgi:hypothetical protein
VDHHAQLFMGRDWVSQTFHLGWPHTMIFPISASLVARITSVSHCALLSYVYYIHIYICTIYSCIPTINCHFAVISMNEMLVRVLIDIKIKVMIPILKDVTM